MLKNKRAESVPMVAIVGPTASGKTGFGFRLADALASVDIEPVFLCCDSMQVYKGMDIGTAKPSLAEQLQFPHRLLDLCAPSEQFHAAEWAKLAYAEASAAWARGKLPVLVGGTGFYYRALVRGLFEAPKADPAIRARHAQRAEVEGVPALHALLAQVDPDAATRLGPNDLVRVSRALEIYEQTGKPISVLQRETNPPGPTRRVSVWIDPPKEELAQAIRTRVDQMMAAGFQEEVERLIEAGFGGTHAMRGLGYAQLSAAVLGEASLTSAVDATKKQTVAFARRQRTWFRSEFKASGASFHLVENGDFSAYLPHVVARIQALLQ